MHTVTSFKQEVEKFVDTDKIYPFGNNTYLLEFPYQLGYNPELRANNRLSLIVTLDARHQKLRIKDDNDTYREYQHVSKNKFNQTYVDDLLKMYPGVKLNEYQQLTYTDSSKPITNFKNGIQLMVKLILNINSLYQIEQFKQKTNQQTVSKPVQQFLNLYTNHNPKLKAELLNFIQNVFKVNSKPSTRIYQIMGPSRSGKTTLQSSFNNDNNLIEINYGQLYGQPDSSKYCQTITNQFQKLINGDLHASINLWVDDRNISTPAKDERLHQLMEKIETIYHNAGKFSIENPSPLNNDDMPNINWLIVGTSPYQLNNIDMAYQIPNNPHFDAECFQQPEDVFSSNEFRNELLKLKL